MWSTNYIQLSLYRSIFFIKKKKKKERFKHLLSINSNLQKVGMNIFKS